MKKLSIIVPAYNEAAFIVPLLEKIQGIPTEKLGYEKEIIVVDDGSQDDTADLARGFDGVRVIQQPNQGKGRAVQRGGRESTGEWLLVQDADLEYDPDDYLPMLEALGKGGLVSVYGSRPLGVMRERGWGVFPGRHARQGIGPWGMNWVLAGVCLLLYGRWITDLLTAYKLYPAHLVKSFTVRTHGFETDHELTAKLIRSGVKIIEIPIAYEPRSLEEGKKIRPIDGLIAVWTLLKFRWAD
ncbi:MAG: glycosyltransferase family 2 protein [Magnetococcales bacterium]|nr:glycosyltransferase family 2 protein [Magnetococcales bacterium]